MMTTDQVSSYLEKLHSRDQKSTEVETVKAEEPKATEPSNTEETEVKENQTVELSDADKENKTGSDVSSNPDTDAKPAEVSEKKVTDDSKSVADKKSERPEKKFTKQEQIDYSFQKLKAKEEAKRKKLEARIAFLEKSLKESKSKEAPSFKDQPEEFLRQEIDRQSKESEKERLEKEYFESKTREADEINKMRIEQCFKDERERDTYNTLVKEHGKELVDILDKRDPESAVLGYLDDSDVSPILIRILMTNKEYRDEVLSKSSPIAKFRAMERLEAKVRWAQQQLENRRKKEEVPPANADSKVDEKKKLPVVGSVTKSDSDNGTLVKDYNTLLHNLNANRRR